MKPKIKRGWIVVGWLAAMATSSSGVGVNAALTSSICDGWISDMPDMPSCRAWRAKRRRPSMSFRSVQTPSTACTWAAAAAVAIAERA